MWENLMALLFFALIYLYFFGSYFSGSKRTFIHIYIILAVFHDYIFINLGYYLSAEVLFIIKSWQEYLLLFLLIILAGKISSGHFRVSIEVTKSLFVILTLTLLGAVIGVANGFNSFDIFLGWRRYLLVILNPLIMHQIGVFKNLSFSSIYKLLISIVVAAGGYAAYQYVQFSKLDLTGLNFDSIDFYERAPIVLQNFWFYDRFDAQHMLASWPNYIRGGVVRVTSFFVSPITFSEFLALVSFFSIGYFNVKHSPPFNRMSSVFVLCLIIGLMWISHTRIGLVQILVGFVLSYFLLRQKVASDIYWLLILSAVATLFILLAVFNIGDDSAQGRLTQYVEFFTNIKIVGEGFGSKVSTIHYDSLYISVGFLFGFFSVLYFYLHYIWISTFFKMRFTAITQKFIDSDFQILFGIVVSFIFAGAFQFSIGSAGTTLFYLLLFWGTYKFREVKSQ